MSILMGFSITVEFTLTGTPNIFNFELMELKCFKPSFLTTNLKEIS